MVRGGTRSAALRAEVTVMPELDAKEREELKDSDFAYVDKSGDRHLPINDESHVRNAMARWNQTDFDSKTAK